MDVSMTLDRLLARLNVQGESVFLLGCRYPVFSQRDMNPAFGAGEICYQVACPTEKARNRWFFPSWRVR